MTEETRVALENNDWLIQNREDIELDWQTATLGLTIGGVDMDELIRPGFTPATGTE